MLTLEARKVGGRGESSGWSEKRRRVASSEGYAGEVGQGKVGLAGVCIEGDEERHISTRLRTSGSRGRGSRSPAVYHACLRRRPTSASARIPSSSAPQIPEIERSSTFLVNVEDPKIDRTPFRCSMLRSDLSEPRERVESARAIENQATFIKQEQ